MTKFRILYHESENSSMSFRLPAIFIIQKNKWKWLLIRWTPPWYLNAWPSARRWPTRARTSASTSPSTLPFRSPWIPGRKKWTQLWARSGQALQPKGGMQDEEKSSWERSLTFHLFHLLLWILLQISLPVQLLRKLRLWQLQMQLPLLLQKLLHFLLRLSKRLKVTKFRRNFHLKVLKFLLPEDLTHMSPLDQNHLRYSLGHVTGFVHIGAVVQGRLRRISSSSCDKSDAVSSSYVLYTWGNKLLLLSCVKILPSGSWVKPLTWAACSTQWIFVQNLCEGVLHANEI